MIPDVPNKTRPHPVPLLRSTLAPWRDILKIQQYRVPAPFDFAERSYREHLIIMRLGRPGTVECNIGGESSSEVFYPIELSFIASGDPYFARSKEESEALVLTLDPTFVSAVAHSGGLNRVELTSRKHFQDSQFEHLLWTLQSEMKAKCPSGRLFGESLATAISTHLLRCYSVIPFKEPSYRGGLSPPLLRRVVNYVKAHLDEDLTLRRLAKIAKMSPYHFARAFKESTGLSPHQYVLEQRIARAKKVLKDSNASLAEIAYKLGFPSQSHFTMMFRKIVGITPGAYRKLP